MTEVAPNRIDRFPPQATESFWNFLDEIRLSGCATDPDQVSSAQYALLLYAVGQWPASVRQIANDLAAIFAKTPAEQAEVKVIAAKWAARLVPGIFSNAALASQAKSIEETSSDQEHALIRRVAYGLMAIFGLIFIAACIAHLTAPLHDSGSSGSLSEKTALPFNRVSMELPTWIALALVTFLFSLLAAGVSLIGFATTPRRTRKDIDLGSIEIQSSDCPAYDPVCFDTAVANFSRHRRADTGEIDVDRSVDATVRMAGIFSVVSGERSLAAEYVALIEEFGPDDHLARYSDLIADRMEERGIPLNRYYFASPDFLTDRARTPVSFSTFADSHRDMRLIVLGPGEAVYEGHSSLLAAALKDPLNWDFRGYLVTGLIDPTTAADLVSAGFIVSSATSMGVRAMSRMLAAYDADKGAIAGTVPGLGWEVPDGEYQARPSVPAPGAPSVEDGIANASSRHQNNISLLAELNEHVDYLRRQAEQDPDRHLEKLAFSLLNLARHASLINYHRTAGEAITEAVQIYRDNLASWPQTYWSAAEAFVLMSDLLTKAGSRTRALTVSEDAIQLYKHLANEDPAVAPSLAKVLLQRAITLRELYFPPSRRVNVSYLGGASSEESSRLIQYAEEAVSGIRTAMTSQPKLAFELALALSNLAFVRRHTDKFHPEERLVWEAFEIARLGCEYEPETFRPLLNEIVLELTDDLALLSDVEMQILREHLSSTS